MKVLFYVRANYQEQKGGDLVQMHQTATALERLGVEIKFSSDPKKDLSNYDLVHCFNSPRFYETATFFKNAREQNRPIAFSTIYWPKDDLAVGLASSGKIRFARKLLGVKAAKLLWRNIKWPNHYMPSASEHLERKLFKEADMLLPNSESELEKIESTYHLRRLPNKVVTNAIDTKLFAQEPAKERDDYILSVGRIENRKNTLKLIEAAHKVRKKLVLIGGYDNNDNYAKECLKLAKAYKVIHINNIAQEKLLHYYYKAKVHAMVSWYETPGLASLEAACGGCNIVSTAKGSTKDYFGNSVIYCDPFSQSSIETAITKAFSDTTDKGLRRKIMKEYTWEKAAQQTLNAYREIT